MPSLAFSSVFWSRRAPLKDAKLIVVIQDQAGRERIWVPQGRLSISGRANARPMTGSARNSDAVLRESGVSNTPQLFDSITDAS
jgi:hypothetical protein